MTFTATVRRMTLGLMTFLAWTVVVDVDDSKGQERVRKARKASPVLAPIEDVDGLPRVLLIGDSISIGYTLPVRELLKGKANVHRPAVNCGPTTLGITAIDQWLGDSKWDVIHFNWGLHDLKYVNEDGKTLVDIGAPKSRQQVSLQDYERNLVDLVERLKQTGAHLIWRNTTPVPEGSRGRVAKDAELYNEVAAKVMSEHSIPVQDMYSFVKPRMEELMLPNANVHFTPAGSNALAQEVANAILEALKPN